MPPFALCQVLDTADADTLVSQLTPHLQSWSPSQLAAAVTSSLPCLGDIPPSDGQQFALLFAGVGAAAAGMSPQEAARVLMVLAQLPGYAPNAQVIALAPPVPQVAAMFSLMLSLLTHGVWGQCTPGHQQQLGGQHMCVPPSSLLLGHA